MNKDVDDDDDDNDDNAIYTTEKKIRISGNVPTMVIARNRSVRTENTPVGGKFARRYRQPSPPVSGHYDFSQINKDARQFDDDRDNNDVADADFARTRRGNADGLDILATGIKQDASSFVVPGFDDYQREDGLKGAQGGSGTDDQFNIDYMREYDRRLKLLDESPDYRFARRVLGFTNGDVFYILDESAFRREIEHSVARAREEARKALSNANTINEMRKEVKVRQEELKEVSSRINQLVLRSKTWAQARDAFYTKRTSADKIVARNNTLDSVVIAPETAKTLMESRGLDTLEKQTFDLMARVAFMKYGFEGLLNKSFAIDVEVLFRTVTLGVLRARNDQDLVLQMPQVSDVVLYVATLGALCSSRELITQAAGKITFIDDSEYSKSHELFASDMQILSDMLLPDENKAQVAGPVTFQFISLLFYAHLNEIVRKLGFSDAEKIAKPTSEQQNEVSKTRRKKIFGKEVDINVDDDILAKAAVGEKTSFTELELLEYKRKYFFNSESQKTLSLIQKILLPVFQNGFGLLFFVDVDRDSSERNELYGESRYPVEKPQLVRSVFQKFKTEKLSGVGTSVAEIFDVSMSLLVFEKTEPFEVRKYDKKAIAAAYGRNLIELFLSQNNSLGDWIRYEKNLRNSVVKRILLPEIAKLLSALDDDVVIIESSDGGDTKRPVVFTLSEKKAILDYLMLDPQASTKQRDELTQAVLDVYDNRIPYARSLADKTKLNGIKQTPSNWSFDTLLQQNADEPAFPVPAELQQTKDALENSIRKFKERISEVLSKTPDEINKEIQKNLGFSTSTSRQWASLPTNSGIMTLSPRFTSALAQAYHLVMDEVPNLAHLSEEDLQYSEKTETAFASLVAHKILEINASNPGQYQRDKTKLDIKIMIADDIYKLRCVRLSSSHPKRLLQSSGAPGASRSLKRDFAEFFK